MAFLEITKMRPLDVVLMSGKRAFSKVIMLSSSVAAWRLAKYSHATLMLSPSMCVEALDGVAIVTTDYAATSELICRWVDGRLAVFVRLDDISDAMVLRHRTITPDLKNVCLHLGYRREVLQTLAEVYLKQYSPLARLLKPVVDLPPVALRFIELLTRKLDGFKPEPGPFCSELVCMLLAQRDSELEAKLSFEMVSPVSAKQDRVPGKPAPDTTSPSALAWREELMHPLAGEEDPVHTCLQSALPGELCEDAFSLRITEILRSGVAAPEFLRTKILKIMSTIPAVLADSDHPETRAQQLENLEVIYAESRSLLRQLWVLELERNLMTFSDPIWEWVEKSNACIASCPVQRHDLFPPWCDWPRKEQRSAFVAAPAWKAEVERMKQWDGSSCSATRDCVVNRLSTLQDKIDEARAELKAELERESERVVADLRAGHAGPGNPPRTTE